MRFCLGSSACTVARLRFHADVSIADAILFGFKRRMLAIALNATRVVSIADAILFGFKLHLAPCCRCGVHLGFNR